MENLIQLQYTHSRFCTSGKLEIIQENRRNLGLVSCIILQCNMCEKEYKCTTFDAKKYLSHINTACVWRSTASRSTYTQMRDVFSSMDVPFLSYGIFSKIEKDVSRSWKKYLWKSMEDAKRK